MRRSDRTAAKAAVRASMSGNVLGQMRRRLRQLAGQGKAPARYLDGQISGWKQTAPETAIGAG